MSLRKYVVLELERPRKRGESIVQQLASGVGEDGPRVSIAELGEKEARRMLASDTCVGLAPEMPVQIAPPMRLNGQAWEVEPADAEPLLPPAGPVVMWGLEAIGVLRPKQLTGEGISVAIIDSGIDLEHDAFRPIRDRIKVQDYTGAGPGDSTGHGTHCAGTFFGQEVDGVRIGVAPGIKEAFVARVFDGRGRASSLNVITALKDAIMKAHVVSMSLGFDFPGVVESLVRDGLPIRLAASRALADFQANMRIFDTLARLGRDLVPVTGGSLVIAAAGNESKPSYRLPVAQPASASDVISVGAAGPGPDGWRIATFSNTGPTVSGPGVDILSAIPVRTPGGAKLGLKSGTSMATPHVAGLAALWFQKLRAQNQGLAPIVALRLQSMVEETFSPDTEPADRGAGLPRAP